MNDPLAPLHLTPGLPNYPDLSQLVRVDAATVGNNVYPAFVQQYTGSLTFRDRESCYVQEPNGVILAPKRYDCRLVGSYLGKPLFVTTCCVSGSFSSSSIG